jgi:hypothetical protein
VSEYLTKINYQLSMKSLETSPKYGFLTNQLDLFPNKGYLNHNQGLPPNPPPAGGKGGQGFIGINSNQLKPSLYISNNSNIALGQRGVRTPQTYKNKS